jgi:hypothetical protein
MSFAKRQRREHPLARCFRCRALQASQDAFDESLARRGVRFQAEPDCTMSVECPECGAARETAYHGLDDEMKREATNLLERS